MRRLRSAAPALGALWCTLQPSAEAVLKDPAVSDHQAPARRATAVNVAFAVPAQLGTNIEEQPDSTLGINGVDLHAGVTYSRFDITADSNLGTDMDKIRIKLVMYDIRAEKAECPDIDPFSWISAPFNGEAIDADYWAILPPESDRNSFTGVTFPRAGEYRLCYTSGEDDTDWYLLGDDTGPGIFVKGALTRYTSEIKVWCPLEPMQAVVDYAYTCQFDSTAIGCECMGKVQGWKRRSTSPYDFMALGLPDAASPEWRVWVTEMGVDCGSDDAGSPDPNPLETGYTEYDRVTNYQGYEVHNFGKVYNYEEGSSSFDQAIGTWKLCYCSGLSMDDEGEVCSTTQQQDYPQTLGRLIILTVIATDFDMTVYPTLFFDLHICCGAQDCIGKSSGYGGCSETIGTPRYKIVAEDDDNDYLYFQSDSGCRVASQLDTYIEDAKIIGGHLQPTNCDDVASCSHEPEVPDGCTEDADCAELRKDPTFKDVSIDASFDNMQMMRDQLDICYCDDECDDPMNWFKAGRIIVHPMTLEFRNLEGAAPTKLELTYMETGSKLVMGSVVVNTAVWIVILGSDAYGAWSTSDSDDASNTREMKILEDDCGRPDRPCEWKSKCLAEEQPDTVTGHRLISGNTDYTDPITLISASLPRGQRYGSQCASVTSSNPDPTCQPSIEISSPGWYAVCYCDSNCNEEANWLFVGRELVTGPTAGQTWTRYTEMTFSLNVTGWGLNGDNMLRLLSPNDDLSFCGQIDSTTGVEYAQTDRAHGPASSGTVWSKTEANGAQITSIAYDASGSLITFDRSHGLSDGDYIRLTSLTVTAPTTDPWDVMLAGKQEAMYDSIHEVTVGCDDPDENCYQIIIPVSFSAAEFPEINNPEGINWYVSSQVTFDGIRVRYGYPSTEGRGYRVCWAPEAGSPYVGQVGEITVSDPSLMTSYMGLTTVTAMDTSVSERGAPTVVFWRTGSSARYDQADGPMHLFIAAMPGVIDYDAADWSEVVELMDWQHNRVEDSVGDYASWDAASQLYCGQVFLEMWSEDPDGFPMPDGCYYSQDTVHENRPTIHEIHIRFGKRNGLKANTAYMLVLNTNIIKYSDATRVLDDNFPDTGAIWVWSMDDYEDRPYTVIEVGQASPGELDGRVPPKSSDGSELVLSENSDDPRFHADEGFIITDADGLYSDTGYWEMTGYCLPSGTSTSPISVALGGHACQPCSTEEDCGNGNAYQAPDPDLTWCQSPIDTSCIGDDATLLDEPAFYFTFRAATNSQIARQDVLRLFLHPLTAWNIDDCEVAFQEDGCPGTCGEPTCTVEAVVGGEPDGTGEEFPVNIMRIQLPSVMGGYYSGDTIGKMIVGNLNIPAGGFLPETVSAEWLDSNEEKPDYWPHYSSGGPAGYRLYVKPRIASAAIVANLGDGNEYPFMDDDATLDYPNNILYFRLVFAATLFARSGSSIRMNFIMPLNSGYQCLPEGQSGGSMPELSLNADSMHNGEGHLYGGYEIYSEINPFLCRVAFLANMVIYAYQSAYIAIRVQNPTDALKFDDDSNYWNLTVYGSDSDTWFNTDPIYKTISDSQLVPCTGYFQARDRTSFLCTEQLGTGYSGQVSVLGKLTDFIVSPTNFGIGQDNTLKVFFRTQQMVGNLQVVETEVWLEAPASFEFGQYCSGGHLDDFYYIPEGVGTTQLPIGRVFTCYGEPVTDEDETYNRARINLAGRLLADTLYGFYIDVTNAPSYLISHQTAVIDYEEPWSIWTYQWKQDDYWGGDDIINVVDGTFFTAKQNEEQLDYMSWGMYQYQMPEGNFGVTLADMSPTGTGSPTEIQVLPIVLQVATRRSMRIIAPAGYVWDFLQSEFRYKARATGVTESLIIDGAEADMPLAGVPASPVSEPYNVLVIDYMQGAWSVGVKYGFAAYIRVPSQPPTGSANQFTVEFGYNEELNDYRHEAGVAEGALVKTLINGGIGYTTSIAGRDTTMTFSVQTVTDIPTGGGLLITGPANFVFSENCQPKPVDGYEDFPNDVFCLYTEVASTGQPEIRIYAGGTGIPAAHYKFTLNATNPPTKYMTDLGEWVFQSYSQMSEKVVLDASTTVEGYMINERMGGDASLGVVGAELRMPDYYYCNVYSDEYIETYGVQKTMCDFERWQFFPALGGSRDDRPGVSSALVIKMILANTPDDTYDLVVTAPVGYEFDTDCSVLTYPSALVYDSTATLANIAAGNALWVSPSSTYQVMPEDDETGAGVPDSAIISPWDTYGYRSYNQRYQPWPSPNVGAELQACKGTDNIARITLTEGLSAGGRGYLFRLSVLKNPDKTPDPNTFMLEYAGECSEPFEGVTIWAFENTSVVPTTTATSTSSLDIWNTVTITFSPVNDLPNGGHLRITAPAEFLVPTECEFELAVHEDTELNSTLTTAEQAYAEFLDGDVICEGDDTDSMRGRLLFTENDKYLKAGVVYVLKLVVRNPEVTSDEAETWHLASYEDTTVDNLLDSADVEGFAVNSVAETFAYITPSSTNAYAIQRVDIRMTFPAKVELSQTIELLAPITYYFSELGSDECPEYTFVAGSLRRTVPKCGGNMMWWYLEEETVPVSTAIRFLVQLINPATTPEQNLFQVRQIKADGTRRSSRMIEGWDIIPELVNLTIAKSTVLPLGQCRSDVVLEAVSPCYAVGSYTALTFTFTPTRAAKIFQVGAEVDGDAFDFTDALFNYPVGTDYAPLARSSALIAGSFVLYANVNISIRIDNILMSSTTTGVATFDVTTFTDDYTVSTTGLAKVSCTTTNGACGNFPPTTARRDETLSFEAFEVLGYIDVTSGSSVSPIYYSSTDATITFEMRCSADWLTNDILRITRAEGYSFSEGSLVALYQVSFHDTQHGLDTSRVWSTTYSDPEDYWATFAADIEADTTIIFTLVADLPQEAYPSPYWTVRSYRIGDLLDTDGEVLNSTHPYYPWTGRTRTLLNTNDGAFSDFLLVGPVDFTVEAQLQTPGAYTTLTFIFDLEQEVEAVEEREVTMEVTGPEGFIFADSCFGTPVNSAFSKCTGYTNTATLVTIQPYLSGSGIVVYLLAYNPRITPSNNYWTTAIYTDDLTQYVRWSQVLGYEIEGMDVTFKGNNQLGESASGFFTFTPVRSSPTSLIYIVITPPPNSGFRLFCTGFSPLGFVYEPTCSSGGTNEDLEVMFDNASLTAGDSYTFGVTIYNPGAAPSDDNNYWGVSLLDYNYETFDANLDIEGLELGTIALRCYGIGWTTASPRVLATVMIQIRVLHTISAGTLTQFSITAPEGIMFSEDTSSVKILPTSLPLISGNRATISGDTMYLNLNTNADVEGSRVYNIRFEVINPTSYPHDNTWTLLALKNIDTEFSHVLTGYVLGETSPYDLTLVTTSTGAAAPALRSRLSLSLLAAASQLLLLCLI